MHLRNRIGIGGCRGEVESVHAISILVGFRCNANDLTWWQSPTAAHFDIGLLFDADRKLFIDIAGLRRDHLVEGLQIRPQALGSADWQAGPNLLQAGIYF